jgi:hypothetical protein
LEAELNLLRDVSRALAAQQVRAVADDPAEAGWP